jgi:1-acyl-sn-glycerol-3-phosphate acyltransferase
VGPLYDVVGFGMRAYSGTAFRVRVLGPKRFRLSPRTLIVSTHRKESDVPLVAPALYFRALLWRHRRARMHFAARDDMFLRGFFGGFPQGLSPRARRVLFPLSVGRFLPRVQVHPISSASSARLLELVDAAEPGSRLEDVVPERSLAGLRERARERGLAEPTLARDVLRGDYADLLWQAVQRGEGSDAFWGARAARATADFRELVSVVREGGSLLVFPEGRPSPDGEIGPLRRGLGALIRRAKPERLLPVTFAYDPLVHGRTEVFVVLGEPMAASTGSLEEDVLARLRLETALTAGQFVAHELASGRDPHPAALAAEVEQARGLGRPVDPMLLVSERLAARIAVARAVAEGKPEELDFLAREFESARR